MRSALGTGRLPTSQTSFAVWISCPFCPRLFRLFGNAHIDLQTDGTSVENIEVSYQTIDTHVQQIHPEEPWITTRSPMP